jgi:tRNA(fMet)-specific endonuclease VapC
MTYLLDTDYVVDYLKGQRNAAALLDPLVPAGLAISIITVAEVYEGIYYGQNQAQHEAGFRHFLQSMRVLGITRPIARQGAILRGQLRATPRGKALVHSKDNYDLFIAATALHHKLTLITRNTKDYERIPDVKLSQSTA